MDRAQGLRRGHDRNDDLARQKHVLESYGQWYCVRMALIETDEAARRLARAIASDISIFYDEKVTDGVRHDTLFDVLAEEIAEGENLYKTRVAPNIQGGNHFYKALVDVLIVPKGTVPSKMW